MAVIRASKPTIAYSAWYSTYIFVFTVFVLYVIPLC